VGFLKTNVPEFDERKKDKILQALRSHPVMRMKVRSCHYDSENNVEKGEYVE
jgi:hypothetical protein